MSSKQMHIKRSVCELLDEVIEKVKEEEMCKVLSYSDIILYLCLKELKRRGINFSENELKNRFGEKIVFYQTGELLSNEQLKVYFKTFIVI